jgi:transcriptional regulator with XRE-family HTH domain
VPASSIDVHVGARIRRRRTLLGMSQQDLGQALGITFQQVQKNERGENRVAASRLFSLSRVLDVPISFFFEDMPDSLTSAQRVDAQNARAGEGILPHHRSRGAQARVRPDQRDGVGRDLTIGDLAQAVIDNGTCCTVIAFALPRRTFRATFPAMPTCPTAVEAILLALYP